MNTDALGPWLATLPTDWTEGCPRSVFERARASYDSPPRHYHTWEHVRTCVDVLRTMPCDDPRAVFLALVFHDAVYVAGRTDNEALSAALAREVLSSTESRTDADLAAIERMILATRDHHAAAAHIRGDEAIMLDIDLSVLGSDRASYARYAQAIHDEFVPAAASESRFRIGRSEFLRRLIAAPHVFLTAEGRDRWDAAARANMRWELATLEAERGVGDRLTLAARRAWRAVAALLRRRPDA